MSATDMQIPIHYFLISLSFVTYQITKDMRPPNTTPLFPELDLAHPVCTPTFAEKKTIRQVRNNVYECEWRCGTTACSQLSFHLAHGVF